MADAGEPRAVKLPPGGLGRKVPGPFPYRPMAVRRAAPMGGERPNRAARGPTGQRIIQA